MTEDQYWDRKEYLKSMGLEIKACRVYLKLKQKAFAEKIGFSPNYVSMVEAGRREPSFKFIQATAKTLNCPTIHRFFELVDHCHYRRVRDSLQGAS